jgi:hypothetical protein
VGDLLGAEEDHTVAGAEGELIILVVQIVLVRALTALFVLSGREILDIGQVLVCKLVKHYFKIIKGKK